jgi:hypothetical protein
LFGEQGKKNMPGGWDMKELLGLTDTGPSDIEDSDTEMQDPKPPVPTKAPRKSSGAKRAKATAAEATAALGGTQATSPKKAVKSAAKGATKGAAKGAARGKAPSATAVKTKRSVSAKAKAAGLAAGGKPSSAGRAKAATARKLGVTSKGAGKTTATKSPAPPARIVRKDTTTGPERVSPASVQHMGRIGGVVRGSWGDLGDCVNDTLQEHIAAITERAVLYMLYGGQHTLQFRHVLRAAEQLGIKHYAGEQQKA